MSEFQASPAPAAASELPGHPAALMAEYRGDLLAVSPSARGGEAGRLVHLKIEDGTIDRSTLALDPRLADAEPIALVADGLGIYLAVEHPVRGGSVERLRFDGDRIVSETVAQLPRSKDLRITALGLDIDGNPYVARASSTARDGGMVYRLVGDQRMRPVVRGLGEPSALRFDEANRLYIVDDAHGVTYRVSGDATAGRVLRPSNGFDTNKTTALPTSVCAEDDFSGAALDPAWSSAFLGDADQGSATLVGGEIHLSGDGTELFRNPDNGNFLYQNVNGDFRFEADITGIPSDTGGALRKGGVMIRGSLDADAPRIMANFMPEFPDPVGTAIQFEFRDHNGVAGRLVSSATNITLPVRVAIDKRANVYTAYYSTDGGDTWIRPSAGGVNNSVEIDMGDDVLAGVAVASYEADTTVTYSFDNIGICRPNGNEPFVPGVPVACNPLQPIDVVYLLDASDSMTHEVDGMQRFDIAKDALRGLNTQLGLDAVGHRAALVTYRGFQNPTDNLNSGYTIHTPFTTDLGAVDGLIDGLSIDIVTGAPAATTPTAIALEQVLALLQASPSTNRPAIVWLSDGIPNIDIDGRGPGLYELAEVQAVMLRDGMGNFRGWGDVAWDGNLNGIPGMVPTYDGEPAANTMFQLEQIVTNIAGIKIYGVAFDGNGVGFGTFNQDLMAYAGHVSNAPFFVADASNIAATIQDLQSDLQCTAGGLAVVGDRVWDDANEDGVQDGSEPGLNGVTIELVDSSNTVVDTTVTSGDGDYFFAVDPGTYLIRVDDTTLPSGYGPTYDFDGLTSPHHTITTLEPFEVERRIDFGYSFGVVSPPPPVLICFDDDFTTLDDGWQSANLGDSDQGSATVVGGGLQLSGDGTSLFHGDDNAFFLYQGTDDDFRVEVAVTGVPVDAGGDLRKGGLMVRQSLAADAPRVMINYVPHFPDPAGTALQFDFRGADGVAQELAAPILVSLPVRLAIDKHGDTYTAYYSEDGGTTWNIPTVGGKGGVVDIAMGDDLLTGLAVSSYDATTEITVAFDDFTLCHPNDRPPFPPGGGGPCDSSKPLDIIYLVDRSDSMSHEVDGVQQFEIAKDAVQALNTFLDVQGVEHRAALMTYRGFRTPQENLDDGAIIHSGFTDDLAAVDATLESLGVLFDPNVPAATTPAPIALAEALGLLLADSDPANRPTVVWLSDGVPNIDAFGRGPDAYGLQEVQSISLKDGLGDFLAYGDVGFSGNYNNDLANYDGEVLAHSMFMLEQLVTQVDDLLIYPIAFRGDGVGFGTFNEDLMEYGGYVSGTQHLVADSTTLITAIQTLLDELTCDDPPTAIVGDRVWADLDGDGEQESGEPELNGVTVELLDATNAVVGTTVTSGDGEYLFVGVAPGTYTVRVDSSTLLAGLSPTYDLDGIATAHAATVTLVPFEVNRTVDFGYQAGTIPVPGEGGLTCFEDDFGDGVLDPSWTAIHIGDADQGSAVESGGSLTLGGDGTSAWIADNGYFIHRNASGDFRVEVEVGGVVDDSGGQYRKAGLMVRAGDDPRAPRVMVQFLPQFPNPDRAVLQFGYRDANGADGQLLAEVIPVPSLPIKIAIERRGDTFIGLFSRNGGHSWEQPTEGGAGGSIEIPGIGDVLEVGLSATSYDANQAFSVEFDDYQVCEPQDVDPVEEPPVELCEADKPLDVIYLLDRSDSMRTGELGGINRFEASRQALLDLNGGLAALGDGSRAALITLNGYWDAAQNLSDGVTLHTGLTSDLAAVDNFVTAMDGPRVDATTPTALGLHDALELLAGYADPNSRPVLVWLTDGVPNIDNLGRGPLAYEQSIVSTLSLRDGNGDFLPWPSVSLLGGFDGDLETYDGEVLANAMAEIQLAKELIPALKIYGVALAGSGLSNRELLDFAAFASGGGSFSAVDTVELEAAVLDILADTTCANTGTVGDRLWIDSDGEGDQDATESGIVGATVSLIDANGNVVATRETGIDGGYLFEGVPAGDWTVLVDVATLPANLDEQTYDFDGTGSSHSASFTLAENESQLAIDFGYRESGIVIDPPDPTIACIADDFDDGALDSAWTVVQIGDADDGSVTETGGGLEIVSDGTALWNDDHFTYVYRTVDGDFRAEVSITDILADVGGDFRKAGLVVRNGNDPRAQRVMVQYVGHFPNPERPVIQFGYRDTAGGDGQLLAEVVPGGVPNRLALERQGDTYRAFYSFNDGETWLQPFEGGAEGLVTFDMGNSLQVGMGVSAYSTEPTFGARFDDFALCTPNAPPVDPPDPVECDESRALDVVYILDRSGSMTTEFSDGLSRFEAAQQAIIDLNNSIAAEADGSRAGLVTINGYEIPDLNLSSGATVQAGLNTDLAAINAIVGGLDVADIDPQSTTPTSIALRRTLRLLLSEADPANLPTLVLITDGIPNIDSTGHGPIGYESEAIQDISLKDGDGNFLSVGEVAFRGDFLPDYGTYTGEPIANTMAEVQLLKNEFPELEIYGVALQGTGMGLGSFNDEVLEYAAYFTGGLSFSAGDVDDLSSAMVALFQDTNCIDPEPPVAPPTTTCDEDDFEDGTLGDGWATKHIGDATQGSFTESGGTIQVTSDGSSLWGSDNHFFVHRTVTGDFRIEADITDIPVDVGGEFRKAGLLVRGSDDPLAPRVMVQYVPHFPNPERAVLQFGFRDSQGGSAQELADVVTLPLPVRVALQKQGDVYSAFYSTNDGVTWLQPTGQAGGSVTIDMGDLLDVGFAAASYSNDTFTAEFDNFVLCGSGAQGTVDPPPAGLCEPTRPLDIVYLLDASGSMTAEFDAVTGDNRFEAAQAALTSLNNTIITEGDGSRAAFLTFEGYYEPQLNLSSSTVEHSGLTTDLGSVSTAINNLTVLDIDPDATTPTSLALHSVLELMLSTHTPSRLPVIVLVTDGVPNIDSQGRGPLGYEIDDIQNISLMNGDGTFKSPNQVAWSGGYNQDFGTFDGEPVANAMSEIILLKDTIPDLLIYGVALQGSGMGLGSFNEDLLEFAAFYTSARPFSVTDSAGLNQAMVDLLANVDCEDVP